MKLKTHIKHHNSIKDHIKHQNNINVISKTMTWLLCIKCYHLMLHDFLIRKSLLAGPNYIAMETALWGIF